ncbi:hypothetical protein AYI69_g5851 [Smittium culicis]|uniref:Xylanolytic transcriptional activator regulatory domain-containing protein n=1 Tax=Smittium culicis TaxID=133412 RepID=A0A1R1Y377_9FUNG|nr:hypothetical protein AYI69_g5851 [Smittium culicis]
MKAEKPFPVYHALQIIEKHDTLDLEKHQDYSPSFKASLISEISLNIDTEIGYFINSNPTLSDFETTSSIQSPIGSSSSCLSPNNLQLSDKIFDTLDFSSELENDFLLPFPTIIERLVINSSEIVPILFMPAKLPKLIHQLKNNLLPEYFLYSLLSACSKYVWDVRAAREIKIEDKYAQIAKSLLNKNIFSKDPYYIWSLLLHCIYYHGSKSSMIPIEFTGSALMAAKTLKLHLLDLKYKYKLVKLQEDKEFLRRIWWTTYISVFYMNLSIGFLPNTSTADIFVHFPTNDFHYKYGGTFGPLPKNIADLNKLANLNGFTRPIYEDGFNLVCKIYFHFDIAISYIRSRWLKKNMTYTKLELKFNSISNSINKLKVQYDNTYGKYVYSPDLINPFDSCFQKCKKFHKNYFSYNSLMLLNCINIHLYQSDLVRRSGYFISASKIKFAKSVCLKTSLNQSLLLRIRSESSNPTKWEPLSCYLALPASFILLSNIYNDQSNNSKYVLDSYNTILDVFRSLSVDSDSPKSLLFLIGLAEKIISAIYSINLKNSVFVSYMKRFSIHKDDISPWFVPKYLCYLKFLCCNKDAFSEFLGDLYLLESNVPIPIEK